MKRMLTTQYRMHTVGAINQNVFLCYVFLYSTQIAHVFFFYVRGGVGKSVWRWHVLWWHFKMWELNGFGFLIHLQGCISLILFSIQGMGGSVVLYSTRCRCVRLVE